MSKRSTKRCFLVWTLGWALCGSSGAASVTYNDMELSTGFRFTKEGLSVTSTASNGGYQTSILSGQYTGLWYGSNVTSSGLYTLSFDRPIVSVSVMYDALSNAGAGQPERILDFRTNAGPVQIGYTNRGGTLFSNNTITSAANDGMGTITYRTATAGSSPFTSFGFTHTQDRSQNGFVLEQLKVTTATPLFLDFGTPLTTEFYVKNNLLNKGQHVAMREGTMKAGAFSAADRTALITAVQDIFDRSNIGIYVTDQKPTTPALTVRFTDSQLLYKKSDGTQMRLEGDAYDITAPSFFGSTIDRFDKRKDGTVAVFMNPANGQIWEIADTVAHEAAHGFGARHINPGNCTEVMDYATCSSGSFSTQPFAITEPPTSTGNVSSQTHNPAYHLRKYAVGESDAEIGLTAGTWDKPGVTIFGMTLSFSNLSQAIPELSFAPLHGATSFDGGVLRSLGSIAAGSSSLSLQLDSDEPIEFFGSSSDLSEIDIFLLDAAGQQLSFDTLAEATRIGAGTIARYDAASQSFVEIGGFAYELQAMPVPEVPAQLLLSVGLCGVLIATRRRTTQRRTTNA